MRKIGLFGVVLWMMLGCAKDGAVMEDPRAGGAMESSSGQPGVKSSVPQPKAPANSTLKAVLGQAAPEFELTSYEGQAVRLSDYRGKVVVLEWFNPECPFVHYAYDEGPMKAMIREARGQGVVWLGINSGGPGKQGHGSVVNLKAKKDWQLQHAILVDQDGRVGRQYEAIKTPHMYVINRKGTLVYRGALDSSRGAKPDAEDTYSNYTRQAIAATLKDAPVPEPRATKAWGCSVKYAPQ
jgi:peroxiredoxin